MTHQDQDPRRRLRDPGLRLEAEQPDPSLQTVRRQGGTWGWVVWIGLLVVVSMVFYGLSSGPEMAGRAPTTTGSPPVTASNAPAPATTGAGATMPETTGQGAGNAGPPAGRGAQ